jgi:ABC-type phosphonate transport system ATPase subunit
LVVAASNVPSPAAHKFGTLSTTTRRPIHIEAAAVVCALVDAVDAVVIGLAVADVVVNHDCEVAGLVMCHVLSIEWQLTFPGRGCTEQGYCESENEDAHPG